MQLEPGEHWDALDAIELFAELDLAAANPLTFYRPIAEVHNVRATRRAARNQKFHPYNQRES